MVTADITAGAQLDGTCLFYFLNLQAHLFQAAPAFPAWTFHQSKNIFTFMIFNLIFYMQMNFYFSIMKSFHFSTFPFFLLFLPPCLCFLVYFFCFSHYELYLFR